MKSVVDRFAPSTGRLWLLVLPWPTPTDPFDHEAHETEFVGLLTGHQSDIYLYLRSLVLNPDEASDILQDTNLVLWEKRGQFQMGTNFRAWAFQIRGTSCCRIKPNANARVCVSRMRWWKNWCCKRPAATTRSTI